MKLDRLLRKHIGFKNFILACVILLLLGYLKLLTIRPNPESKIEINRKKQVDNAVLEPLHRAKTIKEEIKTFLHDDSIANERGKYQIITEDAWKHEKVEDEVCLMFVYLLTTACL